MPVTQLGYVGINTKDTEAWDDILTNVIGFEKREGQENDPCEYYRMDDNHHRVALYPSDQENFRYVGWSVGSHQALEVLQQDLNKAGVPIVEGSRAECFERRVGSFIRFKDPEGNAVEAYVCPEMDHIPINYGRNITGLVAGSLGLGHVGFHCKNYQECVDFYTQFLGFRISDYIVWADAHATFLRCNPRHHSLALINESLGMQGGSINHILFQAKSLTDVGTAYDLVAARNLPLIMTLGQHSNDQFTSFYFVSPSGFGIEYGWGGLTVDDEKSWEIREFSSTQIWGHVVSPPPS